MSSDEPAINGVGGEGFAVDGTDSFAIDTSAPADVDLEAPPPAGRGGLFLTLAAGLVMVLIVVIAGSGSGEDPTLRGEDVVTTDAATTTTTTPATTDRYDATAGHSGDDEREPDFDAELAGEATSDVTTTTIFDSSFGLDEDSADDFDDEFDDDFDDDFDDFSSYIPSRRSYQPSRVPYIPRYRRPSIVVPPWYSRTTTTTIAPTTTVKATTTTVKATTTTTTKATTTTTTVKATTTTTVPAVPAGPWTTGPAGLTCTDGLTLWSRGSGLVASANQGGPWHSAATTAAWVASGSAGATPHRAFVAHPTEAKRYWIGGTDGVRQTVDDGVSFRSATGTAPLDVRSLSVGIDGSTLLATAGTTAIWRSVDGGDNWTELPAPPAGPLGQVLVVDATTAVVAAGDGIQRTIDGGQNWTAVSSVAKVVGAPVTVGSTIWWLRDKGAGVLGSTDGGATWTAPAGKGLAPSASNLATLADGRLLAVGAANTLVASKDGVTWAAYGPTLPVAPAGVVRSAAAKATFVWTGTCGSGAVRRLND